MGSHCSPEANAAASASFAVWRAQRGFSFSAAAGPLPAAVAHEVADACRPGPGSILSLPFTTPAYRTLQAETEACLRRLLAIPDAFAVLFLPGGASAQFAAVPMNLLGCEGGAGAGARAKRAIGADACGGARARGTATPAAALYVDSGYWSRRAIAEAQRFGPVDVRELAALNLPVLDGDPAQAFAYVHVTPNETADGLQFPQLPLTRAPLVADLSSEFLTRTLDWQRLSLAYAGTQKTIGTPGLTLVVIRRALLDRARTDVPRVMDYAAQAAADSRLCTPPVLPVFVAHRMLHWIEAAGGVAAMAARLQRRHALIAAAMAVGEAAGLYRSMVPAGWRSRVNPCFQLPDGRATGRFLAAADAAGLRDLCGHPERGGVRLSLYNGLADAAVEALADFLARFARGVGADAGMASRGGEA